MTRLDWWLPLAEHGSQPSPTPALDPGRGVAGQPLFPEPGSSDCPTVLGRLPHPLAGNPNPLNDPLGPTDPFRAFSKQLDAGNPWLVRTGANQDGSGVPTPLLQAYAAARARAEQAGQAGRSLLEQVRAGANDLPDLAANPFQQIADNVARARLIAEDVKSQAEEKARELAASSSDRQAEMLHNGALDAWRHAEWMRRVASEVGPWTARGAGYEHELEGLWKWLQGKPGQPPSFPALLAETLMDLHNNGIGREAAAKGTGPFLITTFVEPDGRFSYRLNDPRLMIIGEDRNPRIGAYLSDLVPAPGPWTP